MSGVIKTNLIKESNVLMLLCVLHLIIEIKLVEERNRYTVCKQLSIFLPRNLIFLWGTKTKPNHQNDLSYYVLALTMKRLHSLNGQGQELVL